MRDALGNEEFNAGNGGFFNLVLFRSPSWWWPGSAVSLYPGPASLKRRRRPAKAPGFRFPPGASGAPHRSEGAKAATSPGWRSILSTSLACISSA
jgi:hypothetical protein